MYRIYSNGGATVTDNDYLKQLFALANKYDALDDRLTNTLQSTEYTEAGLLTIVSKINKISAVEYKIKYSQPTKFNFYAGPSLVITNYTSPSSSPYSQGGGIPYTSYAPGFSVGINVIPNPNSGKLELRGELMVTNAKFTSLYTLKVDPYVAVRATYDQLATTIMAQLIYNFYNAPNFKFYGGFGVTLSVYNYSNVFFGSQNPNTPIDFNTTDPYFFNKNDNAFLLKAGVRFNKRYEIFANYLTSTATTGGGYWALNNTREQIGFIYLFGK